MPPIRFDRSRPKGSLVIVTQFGIAVFIVGLAILIRGSLLSMLVLVLACSLMGGSAALVLPVLGNA